MSSKAAEVAESGGEDTSALEKGGDGVEQAITGPGGGANSPKSKKSKTMGKGSGGEKKASGAKVKNMEDVVKKSFWHREFNFQKYMEDNVPLPSVDVEASYHGAFVGLVEDAGLAALRSLVLVNAMERKYEVMVEQSKHFSEEADKYKHKAKTMEERLKSLIEENKSLSDQVTTLTNEKTVALNEKNSVLEKLSLAEDQLKKVQEEVTEARQGLAAFFDDGFERAKSQVLLFNPEANLEELDPYKIVSSDHLIDEP